MLLEKGFVEFIVLLFILTSVVLSLGIGFTLYRNQQNFQAFYQDVSIGEIEPVPLSSQAKHSPDCEQVTTIACVENSPLCKDYSSPCDVPEGWQIIHKIR